MHLPEFLTRATIWAAVLLYAASFIPRSWQTRRLLWTLACAAFEGHVLSAFSAFYHWSHQVALRETATQAAAMTGVYWSGGIYFNYAMALLWLADSACWWIAPASHTQRPHWLTVAWHSFLFFMIVNGAVIFNRSPTRWLGLLVALTLAARFLYSRRRTLTAVP